MRRGAVALAAALLSAAPALAQPPQAAPPSPPQPSPSPSPQQRQMVIDLAYVLGQSHALHRLCSGSDDNTWRGRMGRLLKAETPDGAYRQRLMQSFNAGFMAESAEFRDCTLKSADAEKMVAARGRDISRRLAAGVSP